MLRIFVEIDHREHNSGHVVAGLLYLMKAVHSCVASRIGPPNEENGLVGEARQDTSVGHREQRSGIEDDDVVRGFQLRQPKPRRRTRALTVGSRGAGSQSGDTNSSSGRGLPIVDLLHRFATRRTWEAHQTPLRVAGTARFLRMATICR